jgi:hypothetical protein
MRPHSFTLKDDTTHFHYRFSELRNFIANGKTHGDVGVILTARKGRLLTFRGFGTIERPSKSVITISFMHNPFFSGEMASDEDRCKPVRPLLNIDTEIIVINLSGYNPDISRFKP